MNVVVSIVKGTAVRLTVVRREACFALSEHIRTVYDISNGNVALCEAAVLNDTKVLE